MGYSIAYNSGSTTPFGTFKQGTITMGLKPQEYTVSSGFTWYANATTPNDNYLIISDTYSQGWSTQAESKPTIWRSETGTTESFVSLVNQLPDVNGVTGFTDSGTAMKYLIDSGKYFVSKDDYLGIVTDGLILNLDAGWYPSYSGSGTTWKDIKGTNNGTLTNGPTFSSGNGGSIVFDGADDYGQLPSHIFQGIEDCTFSCIVKNTKSTYTVYGGPIYTEWTTGAGTNNTIYITIGEGSTPTSSSPFRVSFWFQVSNAQYQNYSNTRIPVNQTVAITCVREGNQAKIYIDGVLDSTTTTVSGPLDTKTNSPLIANVGYGAKFQGNIYNIQIYNRALSASEVLQNYNAQKGRFGL